jgi:hypothetical protein
LIDPVWLLRAIDLALAVIVLEAIVLAALAWRRGAGLREPLLLTVLSGLGLLLGLRLAASGADARLTLIALTLGGLAHAADVFVRLKAK